VIDAMLNGCNLSKEASWQFVTPLTVSPSPFNDFNSEQTYLGDCVRMQTDFLGNLGYQYSQSSN